MNIENKNSSLLKRAYENIHLSKMLKTVAAFGVAFAAVNGASTAAYAACESGVADGFVSSGEICDDGNNTNGDGCQNDCTITDEFSCIRPLNFNNLTNNDYPGSNASWAYSADGRVGRQRVNALKPTIALFGEDSQSGTYATRIGVDDNIDDDYMGFALGFNPGDQTNLNADWIVLDWKQSNQDSAQRGMRLSHVQGALNEYQHHEHSIPYRECLSQGPVPSCVTELAEANTLGQTGWRDRVYYDVFITYRLNRLTVIVDGVVEFDVTPSDFPTQFVSNVFPTGQIGFYTLSQQNVVYSNLGQMGASECNVTTANDVTLSAPVGSGAITLNASSLFSDANDGLNVGSVQAVPTSDGVTVTVSETGEIVITPTDDTVAGTYTVEVTLCDDNAVIPDCDTSTISVSYVLDTDMDGINDSEDPDDDNDGVADALDPRPLDNSICGDQDNDSCDDCGVLEAVDTDQDGICNLGDSDDDGDGVDDANDPSPLNPAICGDQDGDSCDDCSSAMEQADFDNDGICNLNDNDDDGDGVSDANDPSPLDPFICGDQDGDLCDDCANAADTGDFDGDGVCDASDPDSDGDGVCDGALGIEGVCVAGPDSDPMDPNQCLDEDQDGCDECANGVYQGPNNDGVDVDGDGLCDEGQSPGIDDEDEPVTPIASENGFLSLRGGGCSTSGKSPTGPLALGLFLLIGLLRRPTRRRRY